MGQGCRAKIVILLYAAGILAAASHQPSIAPGEARLGDIAYRKAEFESAESYYRAALAVDRKCARAVWGLGRIAELNFLRGAARDYFAAAYRLDPRDPQIIRSYISVVTDRGAEAVLLKNYIALGGDGLQGAESALG